MMNPIMYLINLIFGVVEVLLFVYIIMGLLMYFRVLDTSNEFVRQVYSGLSRAFEPVLAKLRKIMPFLSHSSGMDFSPIAFFILLHFAEYTINWAYMKVAI